MGSAGEATVDAGMAGAVRQVLDDAGYGAADIAALLHLPGELRISTGDAVRADLLLDEGRPLDALVRLFLLGGDVDESTFARALGDGAAVLVRAGLVAPAGDAVTGTCILVPHDELIVASDPFGAGDRWWVPGVQRPSDVLACATPRHHVRRALDLGTGNGIQALLLARHAEQVVAVDVNPHALSFAAFNVALNGLTDRIELRRGDFVEPVAGEQFDLIVSNPPYVLSPETSFVFRDAPVRGDVMCRALLGEIAGALEPGGIGVMMVSWPDRGDDVSPPQQWLEQAGADGVVVVLGVLGELDAAMIWNGSWLGDPAEFARRVDEWRAYYAAEDIVAVAHGVVALRRAPEGRDPVSVALPASAPPGPSGGAQLRRVLDGVTALERGRRPASLVIAPSAELVETVHTRAGGESARTWDLRVPGGLSFAVGLDPVGAELIRRFATPGDVDDTLASFADLDAGGRERAATFLADLVRLGLLEAVF